MRQKCSLTRTANRKCPGDGGGGPHSKVVPRQSILPTAQKNRRIHSPREDTRRAFAVGPPPQKSGSPEPDSCDRSHLSRTSNRSCQHGLSTELLVSPFVGVCVVENDANRGDSNDESALKPHRHDRHLPRHHPEPLTSFDCLAETSLGLTLAPANIRPTSTETTLPRYGV